MRSRSRFVAALAATFCLSSAAFAQQTVQNDELVSLIEPVPMLLDTGDMYASVFYPDESLFPFRLVGVEILWASEAGGADPVTATAIHVMSGNTETTFEIVESIESPELLDGEMNAFDLEPFDLSYAVGPISIAIEMGADSLPGGPGVVVDENGCLTDRNFVYDPVDGWMEGCFLGMEGDFVIRLVVEPYGDAVHCRRGTVHLGEGDVPEVVLKVDGSSGDDVYREVSVAADALFEISIKKPPMGGAGLYAFWIFEGEPTDETVATAVLRNGELEPVELGLAPFCLPTNNAVVPESCPCPLGNPMGFTSFLLRDAAKAANLCLHTMPRDPFPPAHFFVTLPAGTYTVAGIIMDPGTATPAAGKNASLTNAVVIQVEE